MFKKPGGKGGRASFAFAKLLQTPVRFWGVLTFIAGLMHTGSTLGTREGSLLLSSWQWPHTDHTNIHLLFSTCLGSQSELPQFLPLESLHGCRLGHLQDSSPLNAVILQLNTTSEEHSAGTEEAMLNTQKSMKRTLQELPQHSGLDACFPHALADKFSLSATVPHSFHRSMSLPSSPLVNMQREPDRSLSPGFRSK